MQQAELNRADWLQTGVYSIILRGWDDWLQVQCQKESITWIKLLAQQAELNRADWLQTGVYSIILRGWDDWLQVQCQKESITWI